MNEKLRVSLKELAKEHGMTVTFECEYCREAVFSGDVKDCHMVSFTGPRNDEDEVLV